MKANKVQLARLEYLRGEIEAERISTGEILELQSLAPHIEPGDVLLLEWAGVPETLANALDSIHAALSCYAEDCISSDKDAKATLELNWQIVRNAALRQ